MDQLTTMIQQLLAKANQGAEAGQLSLDQLKRVIEIGACAAGLAARMEYPVQVTMFEQKLPGRVDVVWKRPSDGEIIVAWEIDAIDVRRLHVFGHEAPPPHRRNAVGIIRKLSITNAPIKVHALYSYRGLGPLRRNNSHIVRQWHDEQHIVPEQQVLVRTDSQLLGGALLQIVAQTYDYRV